MTYSKFYYGYEIDETNYLLNFKEGAGAELTAELNSGKYTFTDFAAEIKRALDDVGALTYTVTANRTLRTITVAATNTFSLLAATGTNIDSGPFTLMGFPATDRTGASTYTGPSESGSEYIPQFYLQNYVGSADWRQASDASVNKTAAGVIEIVSFGEERFVQFQIRYINQVNQANGPIKYDSAALANARNFMRYIIQRAPFEFMPSIAAPSSFETLTLDSSPDSSSGTGYKLKELYDQNLPGYFETAILKFRSRV